MLATRPRPKPQDKEVSQDLTATYNQFKEFEGRKYTGMKIGRGHRWKYDAGDWKETKITPDKWEFTYAVRKRRAGKAPEGSGVPVGTEYHWYILGHQNVRKLDANTYTTAMAGVKYKLAHKRAEKMTWSAGARAQRRRLIKILEEMIAELQAQPDGAAPPSRTGARPERRPAPSERRRSAPSPSASPPRAAAGGSPPRSRSSPERP